MEFLSRILAHKQAFLKKKKSRVSLASLRARCANIRRGKTTRFSSAIRRARGPALIAELKKASPSRGLLCAYYSPARIARIYEQEGACALSVLTEDRFFKGSIAHLDAVRKSTRLPILQKDFFIDEYQLYEAKAHGADAILLIMSALTEKNARHLVAAARRLRLECVVEVHDAEELEKALRLGAGIIGINNRDLKTFKTDIAVTRSLVGRVPRTKIVISESGLKDRAQIRALDEKGVHAFLIGESLMNASSSLRGVARQMRSLLDGKP